MAAPRGGAAVDAAKRRVERPHHEVVGRVVVVAVLGHRVDEAGAQRLLSGKARVERHDEFRQRRRAVLEHQPPHRGQRIGDGADPHRLDERIVVARAAGVVVLAPGDAVVGDDRQEHRRPQEPYSNSIPNLSCSFFR